MIRVPGISKTHHVTNERLMKITSTVSLLAILCLASCTDPLVMIPGGKLSGEAASVPESWSSVPDTIQFEVRPSNPYSLNIWGVVDNSNLYVATVDAKWVPFVAADADVRVRIDGKLYELNATLVSDADELKAVAAAYVVKYDNDPSDNWVDTGQAYRLTAR
jgi:hypothetical protein